ncbi:MAG: tetratricopeptide repeat protein, partial [Casimicrobiaceae bacterium]
LKDARRALDAGRFAAADAFIGQALQKKLDARHGETLFDLGNRFAERSRPALAIRIFERVLSLFPGHPGLLVNLGVQFDLNGAAERAERCFRDALRRDPDMVAALANLAHLLFTHERFAEALACYDRLIALAPEAPGDIWNNRGVCQRNLRVAGAEPSFRTALARMRDSPQILANLGFLLSEQRRYDEALPLLLQARTLDPSRLQVAAQVLDLRMQFADWTDFERDRGEILAGVAALATTPGQTVPPFAFLSICDDPALQLVAAQSFAWPEAGVADLAKAGPLDTPEPLRLGLVAAAFHDHPVPRLIAELLERLDRRHFEIYAYELGSGTADSMQARIRNAVTHFANLGTLSSSDAVRRIRVDGIAMLFDLTGHTEHARPDIFAAKPAPVQISFLGHAGTLGARYYDCIITDAYATPPSEQIHFDEKFAYLSECYFPGDSTRVIDTPTRTRADYSLPEDAFVFCTQAASYKIVPEIFGIWMRLLAHVDHSVLWLRPMNAIAEANLRREAQQRGVGGGRLVFAPQEAVGRYLARFRLADLYLDTWPFGSHTTVNDALFSGLPVLTLAGRSMAARVSASQVRAAELTDLVATSPEQYEAIALALVDDRARLARLGRGLRKGSSGLALFDMQRYTREFEAMLLRIWQERAGQQTPAG